MPPLSFTGPPPGGSVSRPTGSQPIGWLAITRPLGATSARGPGPEVSWSP